MTRLQFTEKACTKCGVVRPVSEFHKRARKSLDGLSQQCKFCVNARKAEWMNQPGKREARRERDLARIQDNIETVRRQRAERKRRYRREAGAKERPKLPDGMGALGRQHDRECALVRKRIKAARRSANRKARQAPTRTPMEAYRKNMMNPSYVINQRMRVAIKKAMRGEKAGRAWEQLVGYSLGDLLDHFDRMMPKGYSLDDFRGGRLHIDHIRPKRLFDCSKPDELRACWSLANLRPLPAALNLSKGGREVVLI